VKIIRVVDCGENLDPLLTKGGNFRWDYAPIYPEKKIKICYRNEVFRCIFSGINRTFAFWALKVRSRSSHLKL